MVGMKGAEQHRFGAPAQLRARNHALEQFNRWESGRVSDRAVAEVVADLGALRGLLPEAVRGHDPDPEKRGIAQMHRALARLGRDR
jgi:hypothetical protein